MTARHLKLGLVIFWAVWSSVVFLTNVTDALREMGVLPPEYPLASGNYAAVVEVTAIYPLPGAVAGLLFTIVLVWEGGNAALFWRALRLRTRWQGGDLRSVNTAFIVALALWAAFMVMDEVFLAYKVASFEQTHRAIFIAMLVSFLAVRLLPDR